MMFGTTFDRKVVISNSLFQKAAEFEANIVDARHHTSLSEKDYPLVGSDVFAVGRETRNDLAQKGMCLFAKAVTPQQRLHHLLLRVKNPNLECGGVTGFDPVEDGGLRRDEKFQGVKLVRRQGLENFTEVGTLVDFDALRKAGSLAGVDLYGERERRSQSQNFRVGTVHRARRGDVFLVEIDALRNAHFSGTWCVIKYRRDDTSQIIFSVSIGSVLVSFPLG